MRRKRFWMIMVLGAVALAAIGAFGYEHFYPQLMEYRKYLVLSQLADQGDPGYQRLLAERFYDNGDFENSFKWEVKAAEGGDPLAQNFMGYYFSYGINEHLKPPLPDYSKAREWFEKAADRDFKPSQVELCEIYHRGLGVADQELAYFWCSVSEPLERATKFKQLSLESLDPDSQQRVEQRIMAWRQLYPQDRRR